MTVTIAENKFGRYCVPNASRHRPCAQAILAGHVWEYQTLAFLCQFKYVLHAGAYFGDFLPALSKACEEVWAFEPHTTNFQCARGTLLLAGAKNVLLKRVALGASNRAGRLQTRDRRGRDLGGMCRLNGRGREQVRIRTLDSLTVGPVDAIHLDVEGHELPALVGARQTIKRDRPVIVLETVTSAIGRWLTRRGYQPAEQMDGNMIFRP